MTDGGWTDAALRGWTAADNGDGTCTFNLGGSTGSTAGLVLSTLNGPGQELVRRLVLGNITKDGSRTGVTTTSLTLSKTISYADSQAVRLHQQTQGRGMSS